MSTALLLRDVEIAGRAGFDVRIEAGRITEIGPRLARAANEIDGRGGALIPGLVDHHVHLLALAAQARSVSLDGVRSRADFEARIAAALATRRPGDWLRVTGYHESLAGDVGREALDALAPRHPLRLQHQTGSLWILNSAALAAIGAEDGPDVVERDGAGRPTGRIWRGDAWLRGRIGEDPPDLAAVGRQLARYGVTGVTDASVTTDASAARRLADAHRIGALPQRLMLMSGGELAAPDDDAFTVGPVKVLLDDHDLPPLDDFVAWIRRARGAGRAVAVHCVTAAELAVTLAAFETAGAKPGDRIEHGGVISGSAIGRIRALSLAVVTQPAFIVERGDRYAAEVETRDLPDLYRCASLLDAGVPTGGSSDAPYASPDPWLGIAAAVDRRTRGGQVIGGAERVAPERALELYLGAQSAPGGAPRRVEAGAPADLCLLAAPLRDVLAGPGAENVRATIIDGRLIEAADPR
ncbi:MAG TPA: amidohydrolase family protein [Caulobacteraceae bacterium]|nr:amidohydrolase family protein [Caulobacteraceae bacterium]